MPVVISIYNALTGLAVALDGFVLQNPALMIAGMVVGAAGMFLTFIMAKAMNRSISNIIFSDFGAISSPSRVRSKAVSSQPRRQMPVSSCAMRKA